MKIFIFDQVGLVLFGVYKCYIQQFSFVFSCYTAFSLFHEKYGYMSNLHLHSCVRGEVLYAAHMILKAQIGLQV